MKSIIEKNRSFLGGKKVLFGNPTQIKEIVNILNTDKVVILSGIRFAGKTKFLSEMIKKTGLGDKAFYFNKELDTLGKVKTSEDLEKVLETYTTTYEEPRIIILHNINKIEDIKIFISKIYEEGKYKLIIVGNNLKIEGIQEVEIKNTSTPKLLGLEEDKEKDIESIMKYGCIEEVALIRDIYMKNFLLEDIKTSIIAKDIIYTYSIKNSFLYNQTLSFLSSIPSFISLREFNRNLIDAGIEVSLITSIDYINYSLNSKLVKSMHSYDLKLDKEITSKVKYYFADTGLRNSIHGSDLSDDILLENLVYNELDKKGYTLHGGINGRFSFSFIGTPGTNMEDKDLYLHISKHSDKNEIQKEARKLAKAGTYVKPIKIDTNILGEAPLGKNAIEKPSMKNIKRILLVKDLDKVNMRKREIDGVQVVDLYDYLAN